MATGEAGRQPACRTGLAGTRVCLRPAECPFAHPEAAAAARLRRLAGALLDALPGDPDLALDLLEVMLGTTAAVPPGA